MPSDGHIEVCLDFHGLLTAPGARAGAVRVNRATYLLLRNYHRVSTYLLESKPWSKNESVSPVHEKFPNLRLIDYQTSSNVVHSKNCIAADQLSALDCRA
jgi:hypothetical protein